MDKQKAFEILSKRIDEWETKPKTDGYNYELSFIEVMQGLTIDLFQLSIGKFPQDRNKKNGVARAIQTQIGEIEVFKDHVLSTQKSFRQSDYLQETALILGQVYEESSVLISRLCGVDLSGKQIENLCHYYGEQLEQCTEKQPVSTAKESDLHYVMVDGSHIMSREDSWTETKVGRIFKEDDNFSISEKRAFIKKSDYVAHIGSHIDFCKKLAPVLDQISTMVFIADGATWFWNWASVYYGNGVQILDFFHAYEKICQWGTIALKDKSICSQWCQYCKKLLLDNQIDEVMLQIHGIRCQADTQEKRSSIDLSNQ